MAQAAADPPRAAKTDSQKIHYLGRRDALAMSLLLAIPLVALSAAALAGYPLLTGDDLAQNYPLSVLSGQLIAHGQLPVYDPYLWSGTPLLAGASAHALLPSTLLFVFLPHLTAWVLAEALTLGAGAIGAFVLLRHNRCRTLAATLGGATFGLGGFVSSQIVHIDFVSASASLIWCLVALDGIVRDRPGRRATWALVLAVALACVGLSGSPDIVIDTLVAFAAYGGHLLIGERGRRLAWLGWAAAGSSAGLLASAVQWIPTAEFLSVTERARATYQFAASGSVSAAELLVSVVPHLLGGGPIGLEAYAGPYNLAELDAYCGILSLVAIVALVPRWRSEHAAHWRVWYLIGAIGLLLALGARTPVEHLLLHLPVIGDQRLPSRALVLFSLASSMLLGHWVEDQLATAPRRASPLALASGIVAPLAVLGLVAATVFTSKAYGGILHAVSGSNWSLRAIAAYLAVTTAIALAAAAIVIFGPAWPRRRMAAAIAALVIVDLLVFTANQSSLAPLYARALDATNPLQAQLAARLGPEGRYLIVDPARSGGVALNQIGAPDANVMSGLPSAQGYGSLTWAPYATATGTHTQDDLNPAVLTTGVFDSLDVRVLLTVPDELSIPRSLRSPYQPVTNTLPGLATPAIAGIGPVRSPIKLLAGQTSTRWFGRDLEPHTVTLELSGTKASPKELEELGDDVRLVTASGAKKAPETARVAVGKPGSDEVIVVFGPSSASVGLVTEDRTGASLTITSVLVTTRSGSAYSLDGPLSADLTAPHWVAAGTIGPFAAYINRRASGSFWLSGWTGDAKSGFKVRVIASSPWTATETVAVTSAAAATVVRSVADIPGWSATSDHDGRAEAIALHRDGLVQSFDVTRGTTLITFRYAPPGLKAGLSASGLGLTGMLVLALAAIVLSRRPEDRSEEALATGSAGPG